MRRLLDKIIGKSVDDQMKEYITKNGYPDKDVIFSDKWGRMSKIIGKNTYRNVANVFKAYNKNP